MESTTVLRHVTLGAPAPVPETGRLYQIRFKTCPNSLKYRVLPGVSFSPGYRDGKPRMPSLLCNYPTSVRGFRKGDAVIDPAGVDQTLSMAELGNGGS